MSFGNSVLESKADTFSVYRFYYEISLRLRELWGPDPDEELVAASCSLDIDASFDFSEPEPLPWSIAFTPSFRKAISIVDRKLQGRVLSAITELSDKPTVIHGDTRKPLSGELKGYWRYRLGDYRLVYEPREHARIVVLIDFAARGEAYEA